MKPNQYNTKTPQAKQGSLFAVRAKSTKVQTTVLFQEDVPQQQQKEEVKHMPVTTIKSSPVPGVSSLKNTATAGSTGWFDHFF
jgi:hypothetical protein